ncbi:hypothetical protein K5M36_03455 [Chromobacterium vaccinii]|nr:hypothetical protein [Chromobacterium vaccinii]
MSFSRAIQAIKHHQSQEIPTQGIPKLIHQIYAAPGDIPPDLQNNINSIKKKIRIGNIDSMIKMTLKS